MEWTPLPDINADAHQPEDVLAAGLAAMPAAPRDAGEVVLLVARRADSARALPQRVRLTAAGGMPGDRWGDKPERSPDNQITVMHAGVGELVANGQPLSLFGDNLTVTLDLSADALPAGTRLRAGDALLEVTAEPHTGCDRYAARFGIAALKFISAKARQPLQLRGLHVRVVEDGDVWVGAPITVTARPA